MNWNEYKALAIRTESVPINTFEKVPYNIEAHKPGDILSANKNATRLLHAVMGICTELAELEDGLSTVNFVEEVGDVLWYLAIADDVVGFYIDTTTYMNKPPIYWLGELNDAIRFSFSSIQSSILSSIVAISSKVSTLGISSPFSMI